MILSEKLSELRRRANLSQEELAEKLNVSRQSISKWESGGSIPSIDKIIELAKLYDVTTDFLLQDEREDFPGQIVAESDTYTPARRVSLEEAQDYLAKSKAYAARIALGVLLCIISPVPMLGLSAMAVSGNYGLNETFAGGVGAVVLILIVAAAVALFVINSLSHAAFNSLEHEPFVLDYGVEGVAEKEKRAFQPRFVRGITLGVLLCMLSVVPLLLAASLGGSEALCIAMTAVVLAFVSCGVFAIVNVALCRTSYDKLLQRGDYSIEKKAANSKVDRLLGAYWMVVTALYLGISFWKNNWHISWIIWPVAGVLYSALYAILGALVKED